MGDNRALMAEFERALRTGSMEDFAKLTQASANDDFVQEWTQSGERMTKEASGRLAATYSEMSGTSPTFSFKRMIGGGDVFVVEATIDYGDGVPVSYVGVGEMRDGKMAKMTEYFANPFPATEWRAPFVEKM